MKKIVFGFLLVLVTLALNAKDKENKSTSDTDANATVALTGSIIDFKSGESLVGVEVKIEGTDKKTYTDFDGNFTFKNVKPGEYKVITNYISYQKTTETLKASSAQSDLKIKLQSSH